MPTFVTKTKTCLITGAAGSVGQALAARLNSPILTDIDTLDVREPFKCPQVDVVYHLAGAKHAPEGEQDPWGIAETNITGSAHVLNAAAQVGAKVILASTCKACNPETAYGASKLIAERMALNAGHTVVRFYNVVETQGNVFDIWRQISEDEPLPVTPGRRYWTHLEATVELLLRAADYPSGRYALDPGEPRWVVDVARELYPGRELCAVPLRRGDRPLEPLHAHNERLAEWEPGVMRIYSPHDV